VAPRVFLWNHGIHSGPLYRPGAGGRPKAFPAVPGSKIIILLKTGSNQKS